MALAFFGEFDVSNIDELPAGRKPITTKIITQTDYNKLKPRLLTKIDQGQRVFMITPLIEESDKLDEVTSATQAYQHVTETYHELQGRISLLHGKMRPADKEQVMQDFKSGKVVFLVSTTVVEVGIDIPEATVMIIKNAARFGLSQLHQLR
jgi:ATP-dependent DNA helicase RecG